MKLASLEIIKEVSPHPNADLLEIVKVLSYQAIVKKGEYKANDLVVFIQPDTVLPDAEWAKVYKAKSNRVKAVRLRGSWSFGIVESLSILPENVMDGEGYEVSEKLGIVKYEPTIVNTLDAKGSLPFNLSKTDEERYQNINDLPYGEIVDVTLKVDGASLTFYCKRVDDQWVTGITSRSLELKPECVNKYSEVVKKYSLIDKLKGYCEKYNVNLALRGELYGNGTQNFALNPHSKKPLGFALFNVFNLDTLQYEGPDSPHYYEKVAKELDIEMVPMVEKGVELTPALIKKYDEELETINGNHFEGVVIKMNGGKSFKVISKIYDSKK